MEYWENEDLYGSVEPMEPGLNLDIEELLRRSLKREESQIEAELKEVDRLLEERKEIHSDAISEVESKLEWYLERLEDEYRLPEESERISALKTRIREFYAEIRELERKRWLDMQDLERQRHKLERELREIRDGDLVSELFGV